MGYKQAPQRSLIRSAISIIVQPTNFISLDILAQIFIECLPNGYHLPRQITSEAPLLLCRICRTWKTLAYETPELWAGLKLSVDHLANYDIEAIGRWLDRSRELPIRFDFVEIGGPLYIENFAKVNAIFDILCSKYHRWGDIRISTDNSTIWIPQEEQIMNLLSTEGFPKTMTRLAILGETERRSVIINCRPADYLEDFEIGCEFIRVFFNLGPCSFQYLRSLNLNTANTLDDILHLIVEVPRLEKLTLRIHNCSRLAAQIDVVLPFLVFFGIWLEPEDVNEEFSVNAFFDRLRLPALRTLSAAPNIDLRSVAQMLVRSKCSLNFLRVAVLPGILECLEYVTSLRSLSIDWIPGSLGSDALQALTPVARGRPCLCPVLEEIFIINAKEFPSENFKAFLRARLDDQNYSNSESEGHGKFRKGSGRLQCVQIVAREEDRNHELCEFDDKVKEGLELHY